MERISHAFYSGWQFLLPRFLEVIKEGKGLFLRRGIKDGSHLICNFLLQLFGNFGQYVSRNVDLASLDLG